MAFSLGKAATITLVTVALHNMMRTKERLLYTNKNALGRENEDASVTKRNWRSIAANYLVNIAKNKNNHAQKLAEKFRDIFAGHFYAPGAILWQ